MKQPRFIHRDKRIFLVHIHENYWYYKYHHWLSLSPEKQQEIKTDDENEIHQHLESDQNTVTIYCPYLGDEPMIRVQQITGKKRPRIAYKKLSQPIFKN